MGLSDNFLRPLDRQVERVETLYVGRDVLEPRDFLRTRVSDPNERGNAKVGE